MNAAVQLDPAGDIAPLARLLPAFPDTLLELLSLLRQDQSTCDTLARLIRNDPVLCGNVLQLANRIRRAQARPDLSDPAAAIQLIGLNQVRRIAVTVGTNRYVLSAPGSRFFFEHSFAVAITSQELGMMCAVDPGEAYVVGMLHDIGQLCLHVLDAAAFDAVYKQSIVDGQLVERERQAFGVDHCQLGDRLVRHWNLPETVASAVRRHHDGAGAETTLDATISLGETLARALDIPVSPKNRVTTLNRDAAELLEVDWASPELQDCLGRCRARYRLGLGRAG